MIDNDLTPKQKKALAAILSQPTLAAAAAAAGLNIRTLGRYLQLEPFKRALANAESQAIDGAARRLVAGLDLALDTLRDLMQTATSENVRRSAADAWTGRAMQLLELRELDQRITQLEKEVLKK